MSAAEPELEALGYGLDEIRRWAESGQTCPTDTTWLCDEVTRLRARLADAEEAAAFADGSTAVAGKSHRPTERPEVGG